MEFVIKSFGLLLTALLLSACTMSGSSQRISLDSINPLSAKPTGDVISGRLIVPEGDGVFPAMVILHGCGGIRPNASMWASWLQSRGYASLIVDSFRGRGTASICRQSKKQVNQVQRVGDAYAALYWLAEQPNIDPSKIGLMGFSNGGGTTLKALNQLRQLAAKESPIQFRVGIPLYPDCAFTPPPFPVPVLILIGEADDWTPARLCENLAERYQSDAPLELKVYPGALHGFDNVSNALTYLPDVSNVHAKGRRGATIGGSSRTTERAKADVEQFLRTYMPR